MALRKRIGLLLAGILATALVACGGMEAQYQSDADKFRLLHLLEWAKLIEEYHAKTGRYPLERHVGEREIFVRIATKEQAQYYDPNNRRYEEELDIARENFDVFPVSQFVGEIENGLGRDIDERYDPQRVPNGAPNYMAYFVGKDGYLIWAVCRSCPPRGNSFSSLLLQGVPVVKIGAGWMLSNIHKTQTIESLAKNSEFGKFMYEEISRNAWFFELEKRQADENTPNK